ncbi:tetratricopeptide repeat protein 14 [Amazona aestiva]|uniref:Tetratricopeptide repeat protein 14 n=1 Tax=Amazona aestiva TaxID=12930 RepID=A0A0Q3MEP6_AMAAE|nr:tetratricopeptide repeat protein 14 [Amazona aestiva]
MDRELLRQVLSYHGPELLSLLRAEQQDNPDFRGLLPPPGTVFEQPPAACKERTSLDTEIKRFIAKKADLLFAHSWRPSGPLSETIEENEDYYAVMPPLERFMEVPREERRGLFFQDIDRGDIVIGKITSIPVVKDVDRYHEKLAVSLYSSPLPPHLCKTKLGVITSDDFPLHYKRSMEVANTAETFEEVLHRSPGFGNPSLVEYLAEKLGISESNPPSLLRSLQIVKAGVDYFKDGHHVEAMNEYNKALEIDPENVEALVARGALYATKGSLNKAIGDFEIALENCPSHRNARKYLCQTLVERGGQLEEEDKLVNAESYYKKALSLDETFQEAEEALTKLRKHIQKSLEMREKQAAKEERQKEKKVETSAEKLRKLLKEEKRLKKKRKVSTSSSSSSSSSDSSSDVSISSSSSSSSSSDHKKHRKKHRKRSESSRSSKKYSSRASSHYKDQIRKEECYSPPADTSASFLNQSFEVEKLLERQDSLVCPKTEVREKDTHRSFSRTSGDDEDTFGGRSEASRDSYSSSGTLPSSSKTEKYGETDRFSSSWRGSSGSYRKSYDKPSMHYFRRSERDVEGRKEPFKKHGSGHKRYYVSPAGSDCYGKSVGKYRSYSSTSFHEGDESYDKDKHVLNKHKNESEYKSSSSEETTKTKEPDEEMSLEGTGQTDSGIKRNLPQNLINIFNQIAEFEREKGSKQKKD